MSIGEVLAQLRPDFPDISISKIRFLETEGLVLPDRAPSGYRRFSHDDVARLRYVLTAQRDNYLPLRVIKQQLETLDDGQDGEQPGQRPPVPHVVAAPGENGGQEVRLSRSSLVEAAAITDEQLAELESYGLIDARGNSFGADDLVIARTAGELAEYGLEARHLRTIRSAAEREVGLIEQIVVPLLRQRSSVGKGRANEAARDIGRLALRLHTALMDAQLRRIGSP